MGNIYPLNKQVYILIFIKKEVLLEFGERHNDGNPRQAVGLHHHQDIIGTYPGPYPFG